jgi:hypothetical protein
VNISRLSVSVLPNTFQNIFFSIWGQKLGMKGIPENFSARLSWIQKQLPIPNTLTQSATTEMSDVPIKR